MIIATRLLGSSRLSILAALWCAWIVGCGSGSPPGTSAVISSPDEKIFQALDYFEPIYKVDAAGRIINLKLSGRQLPDAVFAEIGKLTELQGLDVYGANFSDDSLEHLKDLQNLKGFGLGGTPITDQGLTHLEKLKSLRFIWLPRATISGEGAQKLRDALPGVKVYLQ